jgi:hypothetical protein
LVLRSEITEDGEVVVGRARSRNKITQSERTSAKWAAVASQARKRKRRGGKLGHIGLASTKPYGAIFIADERVTRQVLYE